MRRVQEMGVPGQVLAIALWDLRLVALVARPGL